MGCIVGDETPVKRIERFQVNYVAALQERMAIERASHRWNVTRGQMQKVMDATIKGDGMRMRWNKELIKAIVQPKETE